jgi:Pheromone A receptor
LNHWSPLRLETCTKSIYLLAIGCSLLTPQGATITGFPITLRTYLRPRTDQRKPFCCPLRHHDNLQPCVQCFLLCQLYSRAYPTSLALESSELCNLSLHIMGVVVAYFIDLVLWSGNTVDRSLLWCDISKSQIYPTPSSKPCSPTTLYFTGTRMIVASNVAIPRTSLCIQRCIYLVLSDPFVTVTATQVRNFNSVELKF